MTHSKSRRWGKTPSDLPVDQRLEKEHYQIFILLAASVRRGTDTAMVGQRALAKALTNMSPSTIGRRIEELIEWGHVERIEAKKGQRGKYRLTSPVFESGGKSAPQKWQRGVVKPAVSSVVKAARAWAEIQKERA